MTDEFASMAKALRARAGLSLAALSKRANYSKAAIGHAETGKRRPTSELARAIDPVLGANGVLIALAAIQDSPPNVDNVNRREMIATVALSTSLGPSAIVQPLSTSPRTGMREVALLLDRTAELRRLDDRLGGADTYHLFPAEMDRTQSILKHSSYSEQTGRRLLSVLSEQAQLVGWASFDAGWVEQADRLFEESRQAATEAGNPALVANALALRAYQRAFVGKADTEMARASMQALEPCVSPGVRALIYDRAAWTFAVSGQVRETEVALSRAAAMIEQAATVPSPHWASWVDETELKIITGRCWSALKRPLRAVPVLADALDTFPDAYGRDKALYLLALAEAYLQASEVELAAATISKAHTLTIGVASSRPRMRITHTMSQTLGLTSKVVTNLRAELNETAHASD